MPENKIVQFETIPQLKLGFAVIGLDEVNIINKYIDDNTERLPDLSSQLVGQIKQDEKSKQLEFDLNDTVPKQLSKFLLCVQKSMLLNIQCQIVLKKLSGLRKSML